MDRQGVTSAPAEFRIDGEQGGEMHASNGRVGVSVFADGATSMSKRSTVTQASTPEARKLQWLVAELDGVRAYLSDDGATVNVVLTKQEL